MAATELAARAWQALADNRRRANPVICGLGLLQYTTLVSDAKQPGKGETVTEVDRRIEVKPDLGMQRIDELRRSARYLWAERSQKL